MQDIFQKIRRSAIAALLVGLCTALYIGFYYLVESMWIIERVDRGPQQRFSGLRAAAASDVA